jgi:hypothetical protein
MTTEAEMSKHVRGEVHLRKVLTAEYDKRDIT